MWCESAVPVSMCRDMMTAAGQLTPMFPRRWSIPPFPRDGPPWAFLVRRGGWRKPPRFWRASLPGIVSFSIHLTLPFEYGRRQASVFFFFSFQKAKHYSLTNLPLPLL